MAKFNAGRVRGYSGWAPVLGQASRGDDKVMVITDFVGGEGGKPYSEIGKYIGVGGLVTNIADAAAIPVGPQGIQGIPGITTTNMDGIRMLGKGTAGAGTPVSLLPNGLTLDSANIFNGIENGTSSLKSLILSHPVGGTWKGNTTETGTLRIKLPTIGAATTMISISGILYFFDSTLSSNRSCEFLITVYPASPANGFSAVFYGASALKTTVRLYSDGNDRYIYIGDTTQTWSHSALGIKNVLGVFSAATLPLLSSGWVISMETEYLGSLIATRTETRPTYNPTQSLAEYVAGSGVDTPLTNAMSSLQMFQNLQKQNDAMRDSIEVKSLHGGWTNGALIKTNLTAAMGGVFTLDIRYNGFSNPNDSNFMFTGQCAVVSTAPTVRYFKGFGTGTFNTTFYAFIDVDGFLTFWFMPLAGASRSVSVSCYQFSTTNAKNTVTLISNAVKPTTGVLSEVSVNPIMALLNSGTNANIVLGDGSTKALGDFYTKNAPSLVTANKTLALSDQNVIQYVTSTVTITVPLNSAVAFPLGETIEGYVISGSTLSIAVASGVVIIRKAGLDVIGYSYFSLTKLEVNRWALTII